MKLHPMNPQPPVTSKFFILVLSSVHGNATTQTLQSFQTDTDIVQPFVHGHGVPRIDPLDLCLYMFPRKAMDALATVFVD
jgi:hypothetical protein